MLVAVPPPKGPSSTTKPAPAPLLPRIALGDELAVRECVQRYGDLVYAIARRFLGTSADVDDACQDVFVALWKNAASFDARRAEEPVFVTMIARRRLVDRARSVGTRQLPSTDAESKVSSDAVERYVEVKGALAALRTLDENQQRVILLSACHGLSHDEIARELGLPLGTVKSHYTRGLDKVKRALHRSEGDT